MIIGLIIESFSENSLSCLKEEMSTSSFVFVTKFSNLDNSLVINISFKSSLNSLEKLFFSIKALRPLKSFLSRSSVSNSVEPSAKLHKR